MKKILLFTSLAFLTLTAHAQNPCTETSTGSDGAYNATVNTTLAGGVYNYTTFNINSGVTVSVTGTQPLIIKCTGAVTINGILNASGGNGGNGVTFSTFGAGGIGVAGGGNGGDGTYSTSLGGMLASPGAGPGGVNNQGNGWSGGGGAGYSAAGSASGGSTGGFGGPAYGNINISGLESGSGGGGGSGGYSCGSGGGGAGGGLIYIYSASSISIGAAGSIRVNGGNGGSDGAGNCGGGGGGSGGSIFLRAPSMTHNGTLQANGGSGGASNVAGPPYFGTGATGAAGRIRLDYNGSLSGSGTASPAVGAHYTLAAVTTTAVTTQNVTCNGGTDGAALATVMTGNAPYTYSWSPSGGNNTSASGLTAGTYTFLVTDAAGCTASTTVTITEPPALIANATATNASCNGSNNGTATILVSSGNGPFSYSWSPSGGNNATATGLTAGTYTCVVNNSSGCTTSATVAVTEPTAINAVTTGNNVLCNGGSDGAVSVSASGGTPGYTYLWLPSNSTSATLTNVTAGCYNVTVTDANGCSITQSVCVTEPTALSSTTTVVNPSCNGGCDGSGTITVTGGVAPYQYTWCNGETTANPVALCEMPCTINVTDANGCALVDFVTIVAPPPAQVNVLGADTTLCHPATITVCAPNAITYLWSDGSTSACVTTDTSECLFVRMSDFNGCITIDTICITDDLCLGIIETSGTDFSITPNPAADFVIITHGQSNAQLTVVYDAQGRIVKSAMLNNKAELNVSDLAPGIYSVKVGDQTSRLVIE